MAIRTFVCASCGGTFRTASSEAVRDEEAAYLYAGTMNEEQASSCDNCYLRILEMIKADPGRVEADRAQEIYKKMTVSK